MNTLNDILLRHSNRILATRAKGIAASTTVSKSLVATFNANIQDLGYTLDPVSFTWLQTLDKPTMVGVFADIIESLKALKGANVRYKPMYPNFPEQVMEASDAELYGNAILHYFSFIVADAIGDASFVWMPKYRKDKREALGEKVKLTILRIGTSDDLRVLGAKIGASNTSISEADKADIRELVKYDLLGLASTTPNKENLATVAAALLTANLAPAVTATALSRLDTATDVLRLATALSGGDVSLAKDSKFRSFKRAERRLLLDTLEPMGSLAEDMRRHEMRWIRLGERLHPAEYEKQFPFVVRAFNKIRNGLHIATFNSKVEKLISEGKASEVVSVLRERPGDFARRLDHLLRLCGQNESSQRFIINAFFKVAAFVSTPVLLQVMTHFKSRNKQNMRVVFPKGNTAKVQAIVGTRAVISADACGRVVMACEHTLNERFSALPKLGKVYVDPLLADYLVPFSQRSASKGTRTLVRGSKIGFPAGKDTLRFFIHWKNQDEGEGTGKNTWGDDGNSRVDLDLSALIYDPEFNYKTHVAYFNLRSSEYKAFHSGDITSAPKGACEFIDIDIASVLAYGGRYVIMMVNSYTGQAFNTVPECYAGWMLRDKPQSGEVFEAKTVLDKIDVTSESAQVMPLIIDCLSRKVIWADAAVGKRAHYANNIASNYDIITLIGQAFTKIAKPDLYTLFSLHAEARGRLVTDPKKADKVFSVETGTPFELETIASEYMSNPEKKKAAKA